MMPKLHAKWPNQPTLTVSPNALMHNPVKSEVLFKKLASLAFLRICFPR